MASDQPEQIMLPRLGRAIGGAIDAQGHWLERWSQAGPDEPREYEIGPAPEYEPPRWVWERDSGG